MEQKKEPIKRKPEAESRSIKRTVKLTADEDEQIKILMANLSTTNFSEFARTKFFNHKTKHEISTSSKLIFELNKAGTNFNQLVKTFNTYAKTGQSTLYLNEKHKVTIEKIIQLIQEISTKKG